MIEKGIIKKKLKEFEIVSYIEEVLDKPGYSHTEMQRTPLGEKIIVHTSKPGLIVGRKGESIRKLTEILKKKFGLENPQIEVSEVTNPNLNPHSVAKYIAHTFQKFGPGRFKFLGYKLLGDIMNAGAKGAEIVISGRGVPSTRSRTWRFHAGHLKKSGDISENFIKRGYAIAHLKSGAIGVKISILTPDIVLPDDIEVFPNEVQVEEVTEKETQEKVIEEVESQVEKQEEKEHPKESQEEKKAIKEKETAEKEIKEEVKEKKKSTKEKPQEKITKLPIKEEEKLKKPKKEEKVPTAQELAEKKKKKDGNNKKE
jgi:small subunit ribosomal protein S3